MTVISPDLAAALSGRLAAMSAALTSAEVITGPPAAIPTRGIAYGAGKPSAGELAAMAAAGVPLVRCDLTWSQVQAGGSGSWDWAEHDALLNRVEAAGLEMLWTLAYGPNWATGGTSGNKRRPNSPATYATFCGAAAARYGGRVRFFEVWNEPNISMLMVDSNQRRSTVYAGMLKAAYPAIKAAAPDAVVITAGLAPAGGWDSHPGGLGNVNQCPTRFFADLLAQGCAGLFDAVAVHPYDSSWNRVHEQSAWAHISTATHNFRSQLVASGIGHLPIWATEWGMKMPDWASPQEMSGLIPDYHGYWDAFPFPTGPLLTYCWHSDVTAPGFGIADYPVTLAAYAGLD